MDPYSDSDDEAPFLGYRIEDIVPRDVEPGSDIDVSDVSSVHTSDLSDWSDREEDTDMDDDRDRHGWVERTLFKIDPYSDSDDEAPFLGYRIEDIVPRDVEPDSDIDVSSVHTSDLSDREDTDMDDDRDRHGWDERTRAIQFSAFEE